MTARKSGPPPVRPGPIALAGDYLASPSMEGAIRTGEEAAGWVARWLRQQA